jgi:hypothetical protein
VVGLGGVLLPGLRRIAARLARELPGQAADLDSEVMAGFLAALDGFDSTGGRIPARLLSGSWRQAKRLWRAERAYAAHHVPAIASAAPAAPWGHPDFVLARAVREGVVSAGDAELIGLTRLEGVTLAAVAAERGVRCHALAVRRWRAEQRLVAAIRAKQGTGL